MGTGRTFNKAPITRPKKKAIERRRREKIHKARLAALGVPEEDILHMTSKKIRELLKHPVKLKKKMAAAAVTATA